MIFPIGDTQVKGTYRPIFSYLFIVLNISVFIAQYFSSEMLICKYAVIPGDILQGTSYLSLISSMFLHGSLMHIIGNMIFLWIFADNIEVKIGNWQFLIFYLFGGIVGSWVHILFNLPESVLDNCCLPCSDISCIGEVVACKGFIPTLGASGAISAVMGAYFVLFSKSRIKILVLVLFRNFQIPAFVFFGFWFLIQLYSGVNDTFVSTSDSGTAWWAHIGGFLFGILAGMYFKKTIKMMDKTKYV